MYTSNRFIGIGSTSFVLRSGEPVNRAGDRAGDRPRSILRLQSRGEMAERGPSHYGRDQRKVKRETARTFCLEKSISEKIEVIPFSVSKCGVGESVRLASIFGRVIRERSPTLPPILTPLPPCPSAPDRQHRATVPRLIASRQGRTGSTDREPELGRWRAGAGAQGGKRGTGYRSGGSGGLCGPLAGLRRAAGGFGGPRMQTGGQAEARPPGFLPRIGPGLLGASLPIGRGRLAGFDLRYNHRNHDGPETHWRIPAAPRRSARRRTSAAP